MPPKFLLRWGLSTYILIFTIYNIYMESYRVRKHRMKKDREGLCPCYDCVAVLEYRSLILTTHVSGMFATLMIDS